MVFDQHLCTYYWEKGDANRDGSINVLNVVTVIGEILRTSSPDLEIWWLDCDSDGVITILDALGIVNVILGLGECGP